MPIFQIKWLNSEVATLNLIIAEFGDDFRGGFLVSTTPAPPESSASLGRAASSRVAWTQAGRPRRLAFALEHAVLGVRLGPVHALLDMLLHAQPLLVTHSNTTLPPLVI